MPIDDELTGWPGMDAEKAGGSGVDTPLTEEEIALLRDAKVTPEEYKESYYEKLKASMSGPEWDNALIQAAPPSVAVFGQEGFTTHLFTSESIVSKEQLALFQRELKGLLDEVWETYEEKSALYDQQSPVWHHFPFGLASYASQVYIKATRFVSLLQMTLKKDASRGVPLKEVEDTLKDIIVYAWYAWAYARRYAENLSEGE
jgi:hypothetical protein